MFVRKYCDAFEHQTTRTISLSSQSLVKSSSDVFHPAHPPVSVCSVAQGATSPPLCYYECEQLGYGTVDALTPSGVMGMQKSSCPSPTIVAGFAVCSFQLRTGCSGELFKSHESCHELYPQLP